jgi:hypothetical protein
MRNLQLSPKDARMVKHLLHQPRPCLLCGGPPVAAAIFKPDRPALWGGKPGKIRPLGYALCAQCKVLPDLTLHVEAAIMNGLVGRQN